MSFFPRKKKNSIEDLDELRELLISSLHSDEKALSYLDDKLNCFSTLQKLCAICAPYDKYSNDPRMAAAHYISKYPAQLLVQVLPVLLVLVSIPDSDYEDMNGNIVAPLLNAIENSKHLYRSTIYQDLSAIAKHYGLS